MISNNDPKRDDSASKNLLHDAEWNERENRRLAHELAAGGEFELATEAIARKQRLVDSGKLSDLESVEAPSDSVQPSKWRVNRGGGGNTSVVRRNRRTGQDEQIQRIGAKPLGGSQSGPKARKKRPKPLSRSCDSCGTGQTTDVTVCTNCGTPIDVLGPQRDATLYPPFFAFLEECKAVARSDYLRLRCIVAFLAHTPAFTREKIEAFDVELKDYKLMGSRRKKRQRGAVKPFENEKRGGVKLFGTLAGIPIKECLPRSLEEKLQSLGIGFTKEDRENGYELTFTAVANLACAVYLSYLKLLKPIELDVTWTQQEAEEEQRIIAEYVRASGKDRCPSSIKSEPVTSVSSTPTEYERLRQLIEKRHPAIRMLDFLEDRGHRNAGSRRAPKDVTGHPGLSRLVYAVGEACDMEVDSRSAEGQRGPEELGSEKVPAGWRWTKRKKSPKKWPKGLKSKPKRGSGKLPTSNILT
jgi:hypothetical protein